MCCDEKSFYKNYILGRLLDFLTILFVCRPIMMLLNDSSLTKPPNTRSTDAPYKSLVDNWKVGMTEQISITNIIVTQLSVSVPTPRHIRKRLQPFTALAWRRCDRYPFRVTVARKYQHIIFKITKKNWNMTRITQVLFVGFLRRSNFQECLDMIHTWSVDNNYEGPRATISRVFLKSSSNVEHPTFSAIVCHR